MTYINGGLAWVLVWCSLGLSISEAALIGEWNFETTVPTNLVGTLDAIPSTVGSGPTPYLYRMSNSASFASANSNGYTSIGTRLGRSGKTAEPTEPAADNQHGFWLNKAILTDLTAWSVLLWANKTDADSLDYLMYLGTGDGFGGTGAETYLFLDNANQLQAHNYANNSSRDMDLRGGSAGPDEWHQVGIVRDGATMSVYLNGQLIGSDTSVAFLSIFNTSNGYIVFGSAKWMQQDYQRTRIHDGLIDQIEIYNEALDLAAVNARYRAVAETIPGDSNFDGVVDGADYSRWADHFRQANTGWSTGDFSGDGVTDAADYTIWADNYSATMTAVTVPEPSAVGLAGLGALLAIAGFRSYPR